MTVREAIKDELIIEVETDLYLTEDGRVLKYDRYYRKRRSRGVSNMWIDEEGNVFHRFSDAYFRTSAYLWA